MRTYEVLPIGWHHWITQKASELFVHVDGSARGQLVSVIHIEWMSQTHCRSAGSTTSPSAMFLYSCVRWVASKRVMDCNLDRLRQSGWPITWRWYGWTIIKNHYGKEIKMIWVWNNPGLCVQYLHPALSRDAHLLDASVDHFLYYSLRTCLGDNAKEFLPSGWQEIQHVNKDRVNGTL